MMMISEWASRLGGCFGSWDYFGAACVHTPTSCGVRWQYVDAPCKYVDQLQCAKIIMLKIVCRNTVYIRCLLMSQCLRYIWSINPPQLKTVSCKTTAKHDILRQKYVPDLKFLETIYKYISNAPFETRIRARRSNRLGLWSGGPNVSVRKTQSPIYSPKWHEAGWKTMEYNSCSGVCDYP